MEHFEFATASEVIFGWGRVTEVGARAAGLGRRAFVVTGSRLERAAAAVEALIGAGVGVETWCVGGEPTAAGVAAGARAARESGCDCVVGIGGGSAIDAAKAVAALATNPGDVMDYLEVVGRGHPLQWRPLPCVAIPTTAGTGAEVTRNAVLEVEDHRVKVSLRHRWMLPTVAIVDPALTEGLGPEVTAYTGLDALTQTIEPFVSRAANPLSDALCREGVARVARSLRRAFREGADRGAREDMAVASLFGGLALANARLGAVHGFAGPLGGMFHGVAHGAICAALLPHVMRVNLAALRARAPGSAALGKCAELGRILTGRGDATAEEGVAWVEELCGDLKVRGLRALGVDVAQGGAIIAKARAASSMKGNPVELTEAELADILEAAC